MSCGAWTAERGVVDAGGRRVGVFTSHGNAGVAIAAELAVIHNGQLQQLLDDVQAGAIEIERLRRELAEVTDTRNRAQAEASRQTIARQEFAWSVCRSLRVRESRDVVPTILRLRRLTDAVGAEVRRDTELQQLFGLGPGRNS